MTAEERARRLVGSNLPWADDDAAAEIIAAEIRAAANEARREERAKAAGLREALETVRPGCPTAEAEAAARYGPLWRKAVIDKALATDAGKLVAEVLAAADEFERALPYTGDPADGSEAECTLVLAVRAWRAGRER